VHLRLGRIPVSDICSQRSNNFNLNMHTLLLVIFIHQHNLLDEGSQVFLPCLGKIYWLNTEVEEFPPIIRLNSVRDTTIS